MIARLLVFGSMIMGCSVWGQTPGTSDQSEDLYSQVVDLYNKKQFKESLELLDKYSADQNKNSKWYYFYGINQLRLENYDSAIEKLNVYIEKNEISKTSRANHYIGLAYFNKGEYEKSINSMQTSLDLSNDPKFDASTEAHLEKAIRYLNYYEGHKKTNILLMIGYGFKSNAIDISQNLSEKNLNGHSINYGAAISYRPIDKVNFVVEPSVSFVDKYSLDYKFTEDSTIQANDALQVLFSVPLIFRNKKETLLYNFSLNSYVSYLPITTADREIYLLSHFLAGKISYGLNSKYLLDTNFIVASDTSKVYNGTDLDATGMRYGLDVQLSDFINKEKTEFFNYGLNYVQNEARGSDAYYKDSSVYVGYTFPSWLEMTSNISLVYESLSYPKKEVARSDTKCSLNYNLAQPFGSGSVMHYGVGATASNSNDETYRYNDFRASIAYMYKFGL